MRTLDHCLDRKALDVSVWLQLADALEHVLRGMLGVLRSIEIQSYTADVGFVGDILGQYFDHAALVPSDDRCGNAANIVWQPPW